MYIEQSVMAYGIEQDMIRAMLPDGYRSLRPVLRINTEIRDNSEVYVEFNTPVRMQYDKQPFTAENAAAIPCRQVLGAYIVRFTR